MRFHYLIAGSFFVEQAYSESFSLSQSKHSHGNSLYKGAKYNVPRAAIEPRDLEMCVKIFELLYTHEKLASAAIYGLGSALVAHSVCYAGHYAQETCGSFAMGIFGATLIGFASQVEKRKQAVEVERPLESRKNLLLRNLMDEGDTFDAVMDLPTPRTAQRRAVGETYIIDHFKIQKLQIANMTMDLTIKYYSNGEGQVLVGSDFGPSPDVHKNTPTKRNLSGGPGFKFNFVTIEKAKVKRPDQIKFAQAITDSWRKKTVDGHFGEWFGLVRHEHRANFYIRIIPENHRFDNSYESVDRCGRLSQFL